MQQKNYSFLYKNGLSLVLLGLMLVFWAGQALMGWQDVNQELQEHGHPLQTFGEYLKSGHFVSATFENWESEFLQMALYVMLTISLRQMGSAESKKLGDEKEEVDREPQPSPDSPGPVKRGGIWLKLYSNSLSIAFAVLFLVSFVFHFFGSLHDYNEEQRMQQLPTESAGQYITNVHFWFESFQNWQSEFLAVLSIVLLSVWLRQKGSPESKPVDAPHSQTGGE